MKKQSAVIIRKIKKGGHGGHHGGSWKVAYADFVTAMMAFFLLLWLISMVAPEKRARVSAYFKHFSIYDQSGTSFMDKSSEIFSESGESSNKTAREMFTSTVSNMKEMEQDIKTGLMKQLGEAKDQVIVDSDEREVRIQMTDKDGSLMFELGSSRLTPKAREILSVICKNIKDLPSKVEIEGHTDALQYAGSGYSNWELSTERASSARKELEANGLKTGKIARVSGFADKDPLMAGDPSNPRNRRISIILKASYTGEAASVGNGDNKIEAKPHAGMDERKDEGPVMVNRFEKIFLLIQTGLNAFKNEEKSIHENNESLRGPEKEEAEPRRNWGPVIKREEWSPVMDDKLMPVIKTSSLHPDDTKSAVNKTEVTGKTVDKPILKNIVVPAIKQAPPVTVMKPDNTFYSKKKRATAAVAAGSETDKPVKETPKGPIVINELSNPVISKDDLFR